MKTLMALSFLILLGQAEVKVGDAAPKFEAPDDAGKAWKSEDHVGKKILVVYFYPASFTGGCTKQACAYSEHLKSFTDKDVEVVGVSGDSVANQEAFKKFHKLNFTLLADEKGEVGKAFGVPTKVESKTVTFKIDDKEQQFTRGATMQRWTFVVGKDGKIAYKNTKVNAAEDYKAILEVVEKLK